MVAGSIYRYLDWLPPLWVWLPAAVLLGAAAWWRRRWPLWFAVIALVSWVVLSGIVAVVVAQYTVAERHRSWRITMVITLATLVIVGLPIWWLGGLDASLPMSGVVCVAPALLGLYVGTRRELIAEMRERAERAERDQDLRIRQARSEERNQIARDMHDVVTHRVSLMVLHATALEANNGRDATTFAEQIGTIGREALDELRSLVEVLRVGGGPGNEAPLVPQPGLADFAALVDRSRELGMPITLELIDDTGTKPPALVEHALYRVAQEALTNVRKHAGNAETHVQVRREPDGLCLTVVNRAGTGAGARQLPGGGHGLLGIAERIRLVGGELTTQATPDGGFRVEATVPLATPAATDQAR
ncbi:histidine kinase [Crossiella sp. CA-258035]|uniref:sensor histidine kinase n=1 Tax=Crossiella sp. CA-258035 TaxID=2981138 RepID=UPI0024BD1C20|nr:histidine kinase [Crossiella sp. CA-258035]WHT16135.1 histidine kinase [Crossiella sp. CA-258035]